MDPSWIDVQDTAAKGVRNFTQHHGAKTELDVFDITRFLVLPRFFSFPTV